MVIDLQGLLEDGTPPTPDRFNPRKAISFCHGQDVSIRFQVRTPGGGGVPITDPTSLVLTVKKNPADSPLFKVTPTIVAGTPTFAITPANTKNLQPGTFVYDIWLTAGGKRDAVVPLSPLRLEAASTPVP